jgi:molybdopterin molybdotransferase
MIELDKAHEITGRYLIRPGSEVLTLERALDRVLAEDLYADRDSPPFARATMDGYACRREDLPGPLQVVEKVHAGKIPTGPLGKGQCSMITTGAMVPEGADCVIMKEYIKTGQDDRIIFTGGETDSHIDPRGQDLNKGDLLLQKGTLITPGHVGIMASVGKLKVRVSQMLKVGILATGSELIEPENQPEGAQIRNSNSYQLASQVRRAGHLPVLMGMVEDHRERLAGRIKESLNQSDLLLLTGGASVGELDLVPGVLKELGFLLEFERVKMQPGKPVSFGHKKGKVCFGLSGNPVSSFVQFELLVRTYLEKCSEMIPLQRRIRIRMGNEYRRKRSDRPFFLPVSITKNGSCNPVEYHGSGHLHALAGAQGFAEIAAGNMITRKGDWVYVRLI